MRLSDHDVERIADRVFSRIASAFWVTLVVVVFVISVFLAGGIVPWTSAMFGDAWAFIADAWNVAVAGDIDDPGHDVGTVILAGSFLGAFVLAFFAAVLGGMIGVGLLIERALLAVKRRTQ